MKLKVLTENIRLVPSVCAELEGEFALTFRQPTQQDILNWVTITKVEDIIKCMNELFIDFENKPELEDENGKALKYKTLEEMFAYNNPVITGIMVDVVNKFKDLRETAFTIEKK